MATPVGFNALPVSLAQLSLAAVLQCGQSFRWSIFPLGSKYKAPEDHEYRLCLRDRVVCLRQSPTNLYYTTLLPDPQPTAAQRILRDAETLVWINDYFQLDTDLIALYEEWATRDSVFAGIKDRFSGIRMLRQDPWENLISFICSSNNNISRISKMVQNLCKHYSPPLLSTSSPTSDHPETVAYHPFPPPSALATPDVTAALRELGFGYRAGFIQKTAQMLVDGHPTSGKSHGATQREAPELWLEGLRQLPTEEARTELLKFMGVGRKVVDCVLLMSLDKREVVPVDTHVHQIAIKLYGMRGSLKGKAAMTPKLYDEVNAKLFSVWGDYAGWAHSVLFTADLKAFASYGLPDAHLVNPANAKDSLLPTPPPTPSHLSPSKRKSPVIDVPALVGTADQGTLAERVKRRRR